MFIHQKICLHTPLKDGNTLMTGRNTLASGFNISNGLTQPTAISKVSGYLLNQYSLDHYNGHLHAATTTSAS